MAYDTARAIFRAAKAGKAGAIILEIARSEIAYTEQRPAEYVSVMIARRAARGLHPAALHPGRPLPGQPQEVPGRPRGRGGRGEEADRRGDRRRLLQRRRGHLHPGGPGPAHAGGAAARQLRACRRDHRLHPRAGAGGRHRLGRRRDRRGRHEEQHRRGAARLHAGLQPEPRRPGQARGHQQDLGPDRHLARRRGAARRLHGRREARPPGAGARCPRWPASSTASPARCSTGRAPCRPTPSATFPGSRPPRSTSPPTSRTSSSTIPGSRPTCGSGFERGWTRTPPASGRAATPTSSSTTRPARRRSARSSGSCGRCPKRSGPRSRADLERTFAFLFEQLNVNGTADHINRFVQAPLQHHAALKPVLVAAADDPDAGE